MRLRPATKDDLPFIAALEARPEFSSFVTRCLKTPMPRGWPKRIIGT